MELKEHSFDAGDVVLNYADNHSHGEAVVLLHGLTSRWNSMTPLIEALSPKYHVFACDLRGHGKSGSSPLQHSVSSHIRDIVRFLTDRVGTPAVVAGQSLGALVAVGVAAAAPALIRGLALFDPPLLLRHSGSDEAARADAREWLTRMHAVLTERESLTPAARRLQQMLPGGSANDFLGQVGGVDPALIASFAINQLLGGFDIGNALEQVRCSVRLLAGEAMLGSVVLDSDLEFFRSRVRDGTADRLSGVGHNFLTSRVSTLVEQIRVLSASG